MIPNENAVMLKTRKNTNGAREAPLPPRGDTTPDRITAISPASVPYFSIDEIVIVWLFRDGSEMKGETDTAMLRRCT